MSRTTQTHPAQTGDRHGLSAFHYDLLTAASWYRQRNGRAPIGSEVQGLLGDHYGESVSYGRLYPNLNELVEAGLLAKSANNRRSNHYRITERGREVLADRADWLAVGGDSE